MAILSIIFTHISSRNCPIKSFGPSTVRCLEFSFGKWVSVVRKMVSLDQIRHSTWCALL